jgi:hypothetical protein
MYSDTSSNGTQSTLFPVQMTLKYTFVTTPRIQILADAVIFSSPLHSDQRWGLYNLLQISNGTVFWDKRAEASRNLTSNHDKFKNTFHYTFTPHDSFYCDAG